ncbi:cytochrome P450 6B2-like [Epargyreus clarus]|uniref:cytochrome P450 6B2-like n=1 Tax=Epargyreus clarus TaxID=520877 RepID=UPI003C2E4ED3
MLLFVLILLLAYYCYCLGTRNFTYWSKKGVKHVKPVFFFGNVYKQLTLHLSISEQIDEWYNTFPNEKYVGAYLLSDLALVLRDPELIKRVLVTDFRYFHPRGVHPHKHVREPLFQNLFTADGDVWKLLRQRLTPAFSSGKLKAMFPLIIKTAEKMLTVAESSCDKEIDIRELMARYTTDFIGSCGFGLDFDSLNEEESVFRQLGKRIFTVTNRDALVFVLKRAAPETFKNVDFFAREIETDTLHIIKQIVEKRNHKPSGRNDFIDLLLELKQKGKVVGESIEKFSADGSPQTVELELDDLMIAAQVFIFFAAGFETSSSASSFILHELAFHPEEQERCQKEIDEVLSRYNGKICYEALKEMKYLEMAFKEAIRLYPSPGFLIRKSVKKYTFPESGLTIDEDVGILIPLQSLHRDPRFFEDPDTFKPARFLPENVGKIPKFAYMPFGEGPRACIGERLGIIQSLAGVCSLLSRFSVKPAPTACRRPRTDPRSAIVQNILGGLPLILIERNVKTE